MVSNAFHGYFRRYLNPDTIFHHVFSPESRHSIQKWFLLSLIAVISWSSGTIFANFLLPKKVTRPPRTLSKSPPLLNNLRKDIEIIAQADLFNANKEINVQPTIIPRPKKDLPEICTDSTQKSTLPYKLINTIILQDNTKSLASIRQNQNSQLAYLREGDSYGPIEVGKISHLKIIFKNTQSLQCEYIARKDPKESRLWQSKRPQIIPPNEGKKLLNKNQDSRISQSGHTYKIKKSLREEVLQDIDNVLKQAKAIQIKNPDGSLCFKMVDIIPGSPYSKFDIQNNDIICNINGSKIDNLNNLIGIFGKIREIDHFEMVIKRNGEEIRKEYSFE